MVLEAPQVMNCKSLSCFWYQWCQRMSARTNRYCHCFFKKTFWLSVVVLDLYLLWQQYLSIFWQCWDKGWQLPDVKTAVQVMCYIMPALAKRWKKINCTRANTSYYLKEINKSPREAFPFTHMSWTRQHACLKTHEEHLVETSAALSILGECRCVSQGYWGAPNTSLLVPFPGLWPLSRAETANELVCLQKGLVTSQLFLRAADIQ